MSWHNELRVINKMFDTLDKYGWKAVGVYDGEDHVDTTDRAKNH